MLLKINFILDSIAQATRRLRTLNALIPSMNECLGILLAGFSLLAGSFFLNNQSTPFAAYLLTYLVLTYRLGNRLHVVMIARGMIAYYSGPLRQLTQMLREQATPPLIEIKNCPSIHFNSVLCLDNISFRYPQTQTTVLQRINLTIPKNKIIALVGISGAGKSSLIDVLLRLYPPSDGKILLDGCSAESLPLPSWRALFGVVPQDLFLFHESIAENIRFGHLTASQAEIEQAARLADADGFVQKLPDKYNTWIGDEGKSLSGGEKQRIALAQALVRNPQVLILDEPTSHLDTLSEQMILRTLERLREEKTMLIVAHRLSTIQMADLIYLMENGTVVEKGTHPELIASSPRYRALWKTEE